jgi:polar amino acid transport system substrate-binding protein
MLGNDVLVLKLARQFGWQVIGILLVLLVLSGASGYYLGYYANRSTPQSSEPAPPPGSLAAVLKAGKITVGISADYPPFTYYENGTLTGHDIELMEAVGKQLGVKVEWHDMDFDILVASIQQHKMDLSIGLGINQRRLQVIDFSNPYFLSQYFVVAKNSSNLVMSKWEDLGKYTVGIQSGSNIVNDINTTLISTGLMSVKNLVFYNRIDRELADLEAGRIQVVYLAAPGFTLWNKPYQDLRVIWARTVPTDMGLGIAMSQNQPELKTRINEILKSFKDSGFLAQLDKKWCGQG